MKYDKDKIKNSLTIEQVFDLVAELGGEPIMKNGFFISKTICHNHTGEGSHKLYYYDNTKLFRCFTDCGDSFDIYELICKVKTLKEEVKSYYNDSGDIEIRKWELFDAILFVVSYFNIYVNEEETSLDSKEKLADWKILDGYERIRNYEPNEQIVNLKTFDKSILQYLPQPHIIPWEREHINYEIMKERGIAYDPVHHGIIIPHFDINNDLIGVRIRTLIKEEEKYGKYKPAILNGVMYNHPLGFNLYNINNSKNNIKRIKKAIVFEGEKSPLLYASYFGKENDISVACCGSSLITYQVQLLLDLGVNEIIIAFDRQFQKLGDDEWKRWTKKLQNIHNKYGKYVQISFMFDKWNLLNYKSSPIDEGEEKFLELFKRRIIL